MQVKSSPKIENFLSSPAGQRFLKFVGMLGSEHDGERANASAKANGLLQAAELTWGEVVGAGPAPSQGGQQTAISDLRARLKIAEKQQEFSQALINRQATEIALQKRAIEGMQKAAAGPEKPRSAGTKSKPNRGGDRDYATDFQRDLNETLDEIEAAIDLNEWEQGFVASLRSYKIRISAKQFDHLSRLARQAHVDVKVAQP